MHAEWVRSVLWGLLGASEGLRVLWVEGTVLVGLIKSFGKQKIGTKTFKVLY